MHGVVPNHSFKRAIIVIFFFLLFKSDKYSGRNNLAKDLKIQDSNGTASRPLLAEVVKRLSPSTNGEVCK